MATKESDATALKRTLNLPQMVFYGTGTILGAGIYALIGKVAGAAGLLAPLAFLVSALLAALTAYAYCQLVARYPKSGGEAEYVYQSFGGHWLSNGVGWLVAFTGIVSAATLVDGFIGYFRVFFPLGEPVVATGIILTVMTVAIIGIRESAWMAVTITLVEITGLVMVCAVGFDLLAERDFLVPEISGEFGSQAIIPVLAGAFLAFYAFIGFEDIVNLAEETKRPEKTIPAAIYLSLAIATGLYLLVALVALASLPVDALDRSEAPLAEMYESQGGDPRLISAIGLIAIVNGVLAQIIMASRILYGMRHRFAPLEFLSRVNKRTRTPVAGTVFVTGLALMFTLLFPIETLAGATSFIILVVFTLINAALIVSETRQSTPKAANYLVPAIAVLLNVGFLLFEITQGPVNPRICFYTDCTESA